MNIPDKLSNTWRSVFKAIAIYAAAAWAIIQVIDFAVSNYGLSRLLLDTAVLVSFGGGMITVVLAWFHGEPGSQKFKVPEFAIIISVIVATAAGVTYLAIRDPTAPFKALEGYRLILELRNIGDEQDEDYNFSVGPLESTEISEGMMYNLAPVDGSIEGPDVEVNFEDYPVMMLAPTDSEWMKVTFVLPFEPADITDLLKTGTFHGRSLQVTATGG